MGPDRPIGQLEFLSFREAVSALAANSGDSVRKVAEVLRQCNVHEYGAARCWPPEGIEPSSGEAIRDLLDETVRSGQILDFIPAGDSSLYDGWFRSEFIARLLAVLPADVPVELRAHLPDCGVVLKALASDLVPGWAVDMRGMASLTLFEAACVMAKVDPLASAMEAPAASGRLVNRYLRVLVTAIDAGEMAAGPEGQDREMHQEVAHAELRVWCRRYGYKWVIPDVRPSGSHEAAQTRTDAKRDLLEQRIATLTAKNMVLESKLSQALDAREGSDGVSTPLGELQGERDALQAENEKLRLSVMPCSDYLVPVVAAVQREFWADRGEGSPRHKQSSVMAWAKEHFPKLVTSDAIALAIDRVACPFPRDKGGLPQP